MKPTLQLLSAAGIGLAAVTSASAQYTPPPPTQPFAGFLNQELRATDPSWSKWDIGGQFRTRYESRENALIAPPFHDFKARVPAAGVLNGKGNDNRFLASKLLLRAAYTDTWWSGMIVGRSSFVSGDNRGSAPNINLGSSPDSDGPAELHQANFTLGNHKEFPVSIKLGRQELSYGDERLVGAFAWNNIGRVFDGAKVRWQNKAFTAEAFATRLVVPDDNNFNMPSDYESFSGLHITTKLVPKHTAELYFFSRNIDRENPRQFGGTTQAAGSAFSPAPFNFSGRDVYTVGNRWKSNPGELGKWDYSAEFNFQFGNYINDRPDAGAALTGGAGTQAGKPANGSATAPRLEHLAMAFTGMIGYTFTDVFAKPRVALEYNYASGDSDPNDGKHGTFDNLYPTNHKFYGYGDYMSWQNMHNLRLSLTAKPTKRWNVAAEGHLFWLADTSDVYYNVAGIPRAGIPGSLVTPNVGAGYRGVPGFSNSLGAEVNLVTGYALNKATTLEAGYSHYFVGKYQEQSLQNVGGAADASWFYLQAVVTF